MLRTAMEMTSNDQKTGPILLCLRDDNVRESIEKWLKRYSYSSVTFASTEEAVSAKFQRRPRLAVVELQQFDVAGFEAARSIQRRFGIPLVSVVESSSQEALKLAAEAAVAAMLVKPIRAKDMLAAIALSLAAEERVQALKIEARSLRQSLEGKRVVEKAKGKIMEMEGVTEAEAYRKIQKLAMDTQVPMRRIAESIVFCDKEFRKQYPGWNRYYNS